MRSAISSSDCHCSVYCSSNIACSELNIGPVTFQWKLWVLRYRLKLSASSLESSLEIFCRSFWPMPMSTTGPEAPGEAAGLTVLLDLRLVLPALLDLLALVLAMVLPPYMMKGRQCRYRGYPLHMGSAPPFFKC